MPARKTSGRKATTRRTGKKKTRAASAPRSGYADDDYPDNRYADKRYADKGYADDGYPDALYYARGSGRRLVARPSGLAESPDDGGRHVLAMGWTPDVPDRRDLRLEAGGKVDENLTRVGIRLPRQTRASQLPPRCSNLRYCSPIEDQGQLGSCTAQAVVGLMEYMMRRGKGEHVDGSRLFVYKVTRRLLGWTGDTGAYLRTAMKAVAAFGVPPERYCPYDVAKYEEEPSPFLYSFAQNYKALDYTRLDPAGLGGREVLDNVRWALANRFCVVFGFSVYSSLSNHPVIPFPTDEDTMQGGHAVLAIGYDDTLQVAGQPPGALIIRNSWGRDWGAGGYGFLPYGYLTEGLAQDFWTAFKWEWLATKQFGPG